ncbi:MAG: tRNA (pseudouridine(54)-N(1))-methyltransferase TrmY [Deltaproteobacteria bacterium]|nr:tRNA (pseudouridine(54)-N(1))-methyltransferase TrmY [Deltaproteobacteria bacterium]
MRRFVVIGQQATAAGDFLLIDVAGTSGRLDVLLRCLRAALLVSHGLRRDTVVYLVLLGGPRAPRVVRFDGSAIRFVRPDERSLGVMVQKALEAGLEGCGFVEIRSGLAVAEGGLDAVLADLPRAVRAVEAPSAGASAYVLDEGARDIRDAEIDLREPVFFVGDHLGFDDGSRLLLAAHGVTRLGLGPVSVHAEDAITLVCNELDRRGA